MEPNNALEVEAKRSLRRIEPEEEESTEESNPEEEELEKEDTTREPTSRSPTTTSPYNYGGSVIGLVRTLRVEK